MTSTLTYVPLVYKYSNHKIHSLQAYSSFNATCFHPMFNALSPLGSTMSSLCSQCLSPKERPRKVFWVSVKLDQILLIICAVDGTCQYSEARRMGSWRLSQKRLCFKNQSAPASTSVGPGMLPKILKLTT